ncbi:hypothetical protein HPB49_016547 [Dermacentor silvarum]|uniref:Uncharacterized protein n=1 Tax=Dermacentor silvarum TaxID=543639 RepID=A0ACB8CGA7_DERSI|nr:hypothetical protein HPB49_016547 [Dermacentor silvarum]
MHADPCLYITRFAHHLEFGDKTHEVSMTALRMVQRMKRDWMHTGRRPSGLCGAALLVASRLHDFNRSIRDLVRIVKVCETTIRKRLTEFGETPSSKLTLDEFMTIDLEEEQDPPCFKASRSMRPTFFVPASAVIFVNPAAARKKQKQILEEQGRLEKVSEEISQLQKKIEAELEDRRRKVRGRFASRARDERLSEEEENRISHEFIMGNTMETIGACLNDSQQSNEDSAASGSATEDSLTERLVLRQEHDDSDPDDVECVGIEKPKQQSSIVTSLRPTAATLGLKESIEECMRVRDCAETTTESGVLDLEGLDDEELDAYIMTDAEVRLKTKFWMDTHAEYLKEMEEKEARKALEAEENANKPEVKKRKRRKRAPIQANTAGEAIEKMLQEKRISNKINYDVLKSLNNDMGFPSSEPQQRNSQQQPSASEADKSETQSVVSEPSKKKIRKENPLSDSAFSALMSTVKSIALSQQKANAEVLSDDEDLGDPVPQPAAAADMTAMKELEEEIECLGEEQDEFGYHEEIDDYMD